MVVELSLTFADLHEQIEMSFKESGFIVVMECPLWVKNGHDGFNLRCPLYPRKQTFVSAIAMSALGQKRTWPPDLESSKGGNAYPRHLRWMTLRSA